MNDLKVQEDIYQWMTWRVEENLEGTFEENFGEVTEEGRVELEEIIDEPSSDSIHDDSDQSSEDVIVQ